MINKTKNEWQATCDKCGDTFYSMAGDDTFPNRRKIQHELEKEGWIVKGNKCFCPQCF